MAQHPVVQQLISEVSNLLPNMDVLDIATTPIYSIEGLPAACSLFADVTSPCLPPPTCSEATHTTTTIYGNPVVQLIHRFFSIEFSAFETTAWTSIAHLYILTTWSFICRVKAIFREAREEEEKVWMMKFVSPVVFVKEKQKKDGWSAPWSWVWDA